jgi:hypothetical protein
MLGDGYAFTFKDGDRVRCRTGVKVCDYELALSFYNALRSIGLNPVFSKCDYRYYRMRSTWKIPYQVYTYSCEFYKWYTSLSLNDIRGIVESSEECMKQVVRGIYEAEGSYRDKYHIVIVYNSNLELVTLVKALIEKLGFETSLIVSDHPHRKNPRWKVAYQLHLRGGEEARRRFIQTVNPIVKRRPRADSYVARRGYRVYLNG